MKARPVLEALFYDTFETPAGEFSLAVNAAGAVAAAAFGGLEALRKCLKPVKHPEGAPHESALTRDAHAVRHLRRQVDAYFSGSREPFVFELAPQSRPTPFQEKVWASLREIPYGETRSYGQLAASLGNPKASRAVGRANGSNPVCLFVPCHRVIGADGSLTGYAYGEAVKKTLLEVERREGPGT